ncbi:MAG: hypothetical protein IKO42_04425, partial [Opitutales bacterium]|nr:hypothetical protein [Opitutales bacterium]
MNSEAIIKKCPKLAAKREKIEKFCVGACCMHQSWGLGVVKNIDEAAARVVIDFKEKPGHSMDLIFCIDKLDILDESDVLVQFQNNPASVEKDLKEKPTEFVEKLLAKMPDQMATSVELENVMLKLFSSEKEFRSWWNKVKKLLVRDPKIECPKKKNDHYKLREEGDEVEPEQELLREYFLNRDSKKKILLAEKLFNMVSSGSDESEKQKSIDEISKDLPKIKEELTSAIKTARTLKQADKLHGIWVRNDLIRFLYPGEEDKDEEISPRSRDIIFATIEQD